MTGAKEGGTSMTYRLHYWDGIPGRGEFVRLALEEAGPEYVVGQGLSYVDLSLFQLVEGLRYAFPNAMHANEACVPALIALHDAVAARPRIRSYLASDRRLRFNESCVFRRYPELDPPA